MQAAPEVTKPRDITGKHDKRGNSPEAGGTKLEAPAGFASAWLQPITLVLKKELYCGFEVSYSIICTIRAGKGEISRNDKVNEQRKRIGGLAHI